MGKIKALGKSGQQPKQNKPLSACDQMLKGLQKNVKNIHQSKWKRKHWGHVYSIGVVATNKVERVVRENGSSPRAIES